MKRTILISCLFIATTAAFGQLPSFTLGIKAGLNVAKLKSDFATEENTTGYQVGAWARFGGLGLYVQPEAYLGSKGNKFSRITQDNGTEVQADGEVKFTTLDIPVLLGTKIGPPSLNVRFMAGPVLSFIIDEETNFNSAYNQATGFRDYKKQTWAAQAGAGVDLGKLSVDARYEAGLSNISRSERYDQKQNLWHLSLGYKIF